MKLEFKTIDDFLTFCINMSVATRNLPMRQRLSDQEMEYYVLWLKAYIKGIHPGKRAMLTLAQEGNSEDKRPWQIRKSFLHKEWLVEKDGEIDIISDFLFLRQMFPNGKIPDKVQTSIEFPILLVNADYELPVG